MKKYLLGLWIFLLAACQEERLEQGFQSGFLIALSEIESEVETRTAPADLPDPVKTEFKVTIRNQGTDKQQTVKWSEEVVPAEPGTYTLTAEFGENPDLGFDQPYYKGEKTDQTVRDGYTTEVSIPCEVANALVSIRIKEEDQAEFEKNFPDAYVKISVGNVKDQMWTDLNTSAYFKAGSTLSQLLLYKGHETGELDLLKEAGATVPKPFQAKDHLIITLGLQGQSGNLSLVVEKAEIKEETISETIPMEWLPKPKVEAEGFEGNELSFVETENKTASIKLVTATALQDLKLKFNFKDEQFISSLPKEEYVLSNPEDKQAIETALGITLPEIGTTDASLDLSPLLAKLQTNAGETTKNSIEIDAKANNRWSSEEIEGQETPNLKYTLTCEKPEFSVSIQKENCWSREFTIDEVTVTSGNVDIIKNNLVYQYYNGQEWLDCATRENIKGRTQQFTEAAEDLTTKEYKVRALYRGAIASTDATATLETPTQLPNGNMDDWHYSGSFSHGIYSYYPNLENDENFWSTNNDYTTRYRQGTFGYPYNCFPAVSYVPGRNGGKAAEIRNTASGAGNTVDSWFSDDFVDDRNRVAGILFTGNFECEVGVSATNYSYTKTDGKEFASRPTALKFWYKYLPYTSDTWQVHVELWDENKNIIIQQNYQSSIQKNDYEEVEIKLNYNDEQSYSVCKYIYVIFQSTITEGANMPFEWYKKSYVLWRDDQQYTYEEPHIGSILTIDDISLVYDK